MSQKETKILDVSIWLSYDVSHPVSLKKINCFFLLPSLWEPRHLQWIWKSTIFMFFIFKNENLDRSGDISLTVDYMKITAFGSLVIFYNFYFIIFTSFYEKNVQFYQSAKSLPALKNFISFIFMRCICVQVFSCKALIIISITA